MAKKRNPRSRPSADRIPLQSQSTEVEDGPGGLGHRAWANSDGPLDVAEASEDRELQKALARRPRSPSAFKHDDLALEISDSDSDDDLALGKPGQGSVQPDWAADSDLEEDQGGVAREDLVGGAGWAGQKKYFYGGNPNERGRRDRDGLSDDELSETEMEALESQKLQTQQLKLMDEEDFFDAFTLPNDSAGKKKSKSKAWNDLAGQENIKVDLSKLSKKEKAKLFAEESPEFAGILHDFDTKMAEAQNVLAPLIELIHEGKIPAGPATNFLKTRFELILNYCTNISCYLTFKIKRVPLKYHPLTGKLLQYKQLLDRMEPLKDTLMPQITEVLNQIQAGQTIETLVKQAKRRVRVAEMGLKKKASKKRLRILEPSLNGETQVTTTAKSDRPEVELTMDERKAVEMYDAMRGKKNVQEDSEEEESDPEEEVANNGEAMGEEERRSITYQMAKNKGLTPKRSKLQRNPRVKNRKKFEKAKVRRKGQVREVRTETTKYTGEYSGINARVKKGIKLA